MNEQLCTTSLSVALKPVAFDFCCGCGRQLRVQPETRGLARALCWWCRSELAPRATAGLELCPGIAQRHGPIENESAGL
jgi:hypothetical protein